MIIFILRQSHLENQNSKKILSSIIGAPIVIYTTMSATYLEIYTSLLWHSCALLAGTEKFSPFWLWYMFSNSATDLTILLSNYKGYLIRKQIRIQVLMAQALRHHGTYLWTEQNVKGKGAVERAKQGTITRLGHVHIILAHRITGTIISETKYAVSTQQ
jgi:hypothetical protein